MKSLSFTRRRLLFTRLNSKPFHFTVGLDSHDALKSTKVNVYSAPEWDNIKSYLTEKGYFQLQNNKDSSKIMYEIWRDCVFQNEEFKPKYFALLPFFFEDTYTRYAKKKFILEMNLLPDTKYLHFVCALPSGITEFIEPLTDVIPIPAEDFKLKHIVLRSRPADFIDSDMFYINRKSSVIFCFDKQGTWNKEGVNHEVLNIKNSMEEPNWFDYIKLDTYWH